MTKSYFIKESTRDVWAFNRRDRRGVAEFAKNINRVKQLSVKVINMNQLFCFEK
jgi:hypothetical protein